MEESFSSLLLKSLGARIVLGLGVLYVVLLALERFTPRPDEREPPFVYSSIPFLGHVIKMISMGGNRFYQHLSDTVQQPIFTTPMFGGRLYIAVDPAIATQIQRNAKTLEFQPFAIELTARMLKLPKQVHTTIMEKNSASTQDGRPQDLATQIHDWQIIALGPGKGLDDMSLVQLGLMTDYVGQIKEGQSIDLFKWIAHCVTLSNLVTSHGPRNPIAVDPSLENEFWIFNRDLATLMTGPPSWLLAPRASIAMGRFKAGLRRWATEGDWKQASPWIQGRIKASLAHGLSLEEAGEVELGMIFGLLANAMPTTFWVLVYVFSSPELTAELRAHLERDEVVRQLDGGRTREISISAIKNSCPLLSSLFREVLRLLAPMSSIRSVVEDTTVSGPGGTQYLLKKGSMVQTAGGVLHSSADIWGKDVEEFDPKRFLLSANGTISQPLDDLKGKTKETVHPGAFRAFGGGVSLCPGRFFALMEIGGLTALFLLGYDLTDPTTGGVLKIPEPIRDDAAALHVMYPSIPVNVRVRRRKGYENVTWKFVN